jgi:hypothetical protein
MKENKMINIKVNYKIRGLQYASLCAVDNLLGTQEISDWVTDFVADKCNLVPAELVTDINWIYI